MTTKIASPSWHNNEVVTKKTTTTKNNKDHNLKWNLSSYSSNKHAEGNTAYYRKSVIVAKNNYDSDSTK